MVVRVWLEQWIVLELVFFVSWLISIDATDDSMLPVVLSSSQGAWCFVIFEDSVLEIFGRSGSLLA